ncbi:VOC family protein [Ureibacillus sinduriensis]|uniref:Glyoxalase n=1 Tax=Ureibacillus sinduriensis BLB-1 = JCM 15800 TaxID=1384057 RepID=A0A0A3I315_9BACL|nr:VOC family protein [Ureibacillus sinduriensis]KGR77063.1 glyoxalase [Ureibacillus sinduriensis BLB-1 = JCM 15800]
MRSASPYIFVENCLEIIEYYRNIFNGEIRNVQQTDDGKCLHAELVIGNSTIHFSDHFGGTTKGDNVRVSLECESEDEITRVYNDLSVSGSVTVELQDTNWGALHANLVDQFGVGWLLNYTR